ncbi:glycosyltransferase 87 family protein [Streptomyces sp. NPDC002889]|uniref:glycosyltransferase 87 family protein n=1 Tax=Streptomyces sp. NPDC002889 TaxID=3364669 RepID=UPI00367A8457
MADAPGARPEGRAWILTWLLSRAALLLCVLKVVTIPGPDVTSDVAVIYQGWSEVLRAGTYPVDDITWQYPPGAALALLSPALLPFLAYPTAFFVLALLCDLLVLGMLRHAERGGGGHRGTWMWIVGLPLLGPTAYARFDVMVTAVAVAALLAGSTAGAVHRPRILGALAGFGALLKVWPLLLLVGTPRGRATRRSWGAAAATAGGLALLLWAAMPGALVFVTAQRDRGTEIESLGGTVLHVARHFGWQGQVLLSYGSVEFIGPYVPLVSRIALGLTVAAALWLAVWRLRARRFGPGTVCDAAFAATLLFTVTSRVISPQYLLWLVGLAAVCLVHARSPMVLPARLVLTATGVTLLEFPVWFAQVVASDPLGVLLLVLRNGLLVTAALIACARLWRRTVPASRGRGSVTPAAPEDSPATAR